MGNCGLKSKSYGASDGNSASGVEDIGRVVGGEGAAAIHKGSVLGLACLANGNICTCSDDKSLVIYNWKEETQQKLVGHNKAVNRVVGSRRSAAYVFSTSRDLSVKQWKQSTGECIQTLSDAHSLNIPGLGLSPDESMLCTGSRDYSVKIWDIQTAQVKNTFTAPRNIVTTLSWEKGEGGGQNIVFQGSEDLCIRGWDIRQPSKVPAVHITGFVYFPTSLTQNRNGDRGGSAGYLLAAGCKGFNKSGCEIKIFDLRGGKGGEGEGDDRWCAPVMQQQLTGHEHDVTGIQFMHGRCTGTGADDASQVLLSVSRDGYMRKWEGFSSSSSGISKRFLPSDRSSYTCLHSWQSVSIAGDEEEEGCGMYCAMGDINGSVHVVDCEGQVIHSTAPGVETD